MSFSAATYVKYAYVRKKLAWPCPSWQKSLKDESNKTNQVTFNSDGSIFLIFLHEARLKTFRLCDENKIKFVNSDRVAALWRMLRILWTNEACFFYNSRGRNLWGAADSALDPRLTRRPYHQAIVSILIRATKNFLCVVWAVIQVLVLKHPTLGDFHTTFLT